MARGVNCGSSSSSSPVNNLWVEDTADEKKDEEEGTRDGLASMSVL
jgi:hypothetical protein